MEITGKIILALPEVSGVSQRTNKGWKKREYVLETNDQYPRKIFFDFFGDRADQYPLNVGDTIRLSFDLESREYNGRWYTSVRGWKSEAVTEGAPAQPAPAPTTQATTMPTGYAAPGAVPPPPVVDLAPGSADDLPF